MPSSDGLGSPPTDATESSTPPAESSTTPTKDAPASTADASPDAPESPDADGASCPDVGCECVVVLAGYPCPGGGFIYPLHGTCCNYPVMP